MELPYPRIPDDITINQWQLFTQILDNRLELSQSVKTYLHGLKLLQATRSLEEISKNQIELLNSLSENAEKLWQSWLRLQPSRLSTADRQLLKKYNTLLKMVSDAGPDGTVSKQIKHEYQKLFPLVAHFLPCWAVTSLSARGKIPFEPGFFDLLVIDEASQCDIASALPLLYRAKQVVVLGDPKQLSHISGLQRGKDQQLLEKYELVRDYAPWAYSYNSLFDLASGFASKEDIVGLRDHHRSHADIIEFSNRFFYEGRLRVATSYERLKRPQANGPGVRWIHVAGNVQRPATGSAVNTAEAQVVINTLRHLVLEQDYKGSIGVVSPFNAHAIYIRDQVNKDSNLASRLMQHDFLVETVHKFQGDERDIMIFSPVISQGITPGALSFLRNNGNLFNVAITRARAMLIVTGDQHAASQCDVSYLSEFARYAQQVAEQEGKRTKQSLTDLGPEYPSVTGKVSDWERMLYRALYQAGVKTIPQYPMEKYFLDLALVEGERRLDIEVDGEWYHREWTGELCRRDQLRNQRLFELGWDVMRFWVYEIRDDLEGCVKRVTKWHNK